jgi:hypothetical protein
MSPRTADAQLMSPNGGNGVPEVIDLAELANTLAVGALSGTWLAFPLHLGRLWQTQDRRFRRVPAQMCGRGPLFEILGKLAEVALELTFEMPQRDGPQKDPAA